MAPKAPTTELQRELDHRSRGSGGSSQAPRNVHRIDRRAGAPPPGPGGGGQRRRRGDGRRLRHDRGDAAGRRRGERLRQRPWHPGRPAPGREAAGRRGRAHHPARRRQVRQQVLRGVRRPARRRRLGRERALQPAGGGDQARRVHVDPGIHEQPARPAAQGRADPQARQHVTFWADPTVFETTTYSFETLSRRLQEMAFLNRGLSITLRDEREETPREDHVHVQGRHRGLRPPPQRHQGPDPQVGHRLLGRGHRHRRRGRDAVERRPTPSRSTPSPTRSTRTRAAPTRRASGPR